MGKVKKERGVGHTHPKDHALKAALKRLYRPKDDVIERHTNPLPESLFQQVEDQMFEGANLTDEEEGNSKKKFRWRGSRHMKADAGSRLVEKMVMKMSLNEVTLPFNFRRASRYQAQLRGPLEPMDWDDNTPRKLLSEDGFTMVVSMPSLMGDRGTAAITDSVLEYAKYVKPHKGKSKTSAEKVGKYVDRLGEVSGEIRLVKGWFGIGQEHKGLVVPTSETFQTGGAFARTSELYRTLELLSKKINETIERVDPDFFHALSELHRRATAKHASLAAWTSVDPLLFEGRELLFNRVSGVHRDKQDPKLAYAGLFAAGNFTSGGHVFFPQLNLRVRLLPGDFVLIRGRVLEHMIEGWEGGQRISIPHFTHTSLWRDCGLADLVDVP